MLQSDATQFRLCFNNILSPAQCGFIRRRSTSINLLECFNNWIVCVQLCQHIAVVYINFANASGVISHKKLLA